MPIGFKYLTLPLSAPYWLTIRVKMLIIFWLFFHSQFLEVSVKIGKKVCHIITIIFS